MHFLKNIKKISSNFENRNWLIMNNIKNNKYYFYRRVGKRQNNSDVADCIRLLWYRHYDFYVDPMIDVGTFKFIHLPDIVSKYYFIFG